MTVHELMRLLPSVLPVFVLLLLVALVLIVLRARRQLAFLRESILVEGEILARGEHRGGSWYLRCRLTNPYTHEEEVVDVPCSREEQEEEKGPTVQVRFMGRYQPALGNEPSGEIRSAIYRQGAAAVLAAAAGLALLLVLGGLLLSWI